MKTKRKKIAFIVIASLTILWLSLFTGCAAETSSSPFILETVDNVEYHLNEDKWVGAAYDGYYNYFDEEEIVIKIQDQVNNIPITQLGDLHGSMRTDFSLCPMDIPNSSPFGEKSLQDEQYASIPVENRKVTLILGKNIAELYSVDVKGYYILNNNWSRFVRFTFTIECSDDNETFYSKDGKLYYRNGNQLADDFWYTADFPDEIQSDYSSED